MASSVGRGRPPFVPGLGPPGGSLPLVLALWVLGRGHTGSRGQLSLALAGNLGGHHGVSSASHLLCQVCGHIVEATIQATTGHSLCQDWGHPTGVTVRAETGRHLRWARGHSARGMGQSRTLLVRSVWTFDSFWSVQSLRRGRCFCGKAPGSSVGRARESGGGTRPQGIARVGRMVAVRSGEAQSRCPARWGETPRRSRGTGQHFRPRGSRLPRPSSRRLEPDGPAAPRLSLVLVGLVPRVEPRASASEGG